MNRMEPQYSQEVFEALIVALELSEIRDHYAIGPRGAFLRTVNEPTSVYFSPNWSPACDLDGPDGPDPLSEPALPFPFTAKQLAAWMLDGWGTSVAEVAGELHAGPDDAALALLGERERKVREALIAAYAAISKAQDVVGPAAHRVNMEKAEAMLALAEAEVCVKRKARLRARHRLAQSEAETARVAWRRAMVKELLVQAVVAAAPAPGRGAEVQHDRQKRRYQMCVNAGLVMPTDDYAHLPRGIGVLAKNEGVTRQSFSQDVKAHIRRLSGK